MMCDTEVAEIEMVSMGSFMIVKGERTKDYGIHFIIFLV